MNHAGKKRNQMSRVTLILGWCGRELLAGMVCNSLFVSVVGAENEGQKLTKRLLAPPKMTTEPGARTTGWLHC